MPFYEYICDSCGNVTGEFRPMRDCAKPTVCKCGSKMRRIFDARINLKGAGKSPQHILGRQKAVETDPALDRMGLVDLPPEQWKWKKA